MHILALATKIGNSITSKRIDKPIRRSLKIILKKSVKKKRISAESVGTCRYELAK